MALLALHPPISPLTSTGQRNCASWASQTQKSVTLLPCPGGKTTKSTRTCGGIGGNIYIYIYIYIYEVLVCMYVCVCVRWRCVWVDVLTYPTPSLIAYNTTGMMHLRFLIQGESLARRPKLLSINNYVI